MSHLPIDGFEPISLEELNSLAALMERQTKKYLLSSQQLHEFLSAHANTLKILNIGNSKEFNYSSTYYDTPTLNTYFDHAFNRRKRYKIRTRFYDTTNMFFLELKLKKARNTTKKIRWPLPTTWSVNSSTFKADLAFPLLKVAQEYDTNHILHPNSFEPTMTISYKRITLLSMLEGVRITIDSDLTFGLHGNHAATPPQQHIVEVKSPTTVSSIERYLVKNGMRPLAGLSKYCIATIALNPGIRRGKFTPVFNKFFGSYF